MMKIAHIGLKTSRIIKTAVLTIALLFTVGATNAQENNYFETIRDFVLSDNSKDLVVFNDVVKRYYLTHKVLKHFENKTKHDNFLWEWNNHYVRYVYDSASPELGYLFFSIKKYRGLTSGDTRCVVIKLEDSERDGIILAARVFLVMDLNNRVVFIDYPEGFMNESWGKPTQEEAQELFAKEVKYWIDLINKMKLRT